MIARHWRGWTEPRNADAYELLLKTKVLPELKRVAGYCGGYILRSDGTYSIPRQQVTSPASVFKPTTSKPFWTTASTTPATRPDPNESPQIGARCCTRHCPRSV